MVLKLVLLLSVVVYDVYGQYDAQHIIDQTQYLQQIEKYGTNLTSNQIYPYLGNLTDVGHGNKFNNQSEGVHNNLRNSTSRGGFNNTSGVPQDSLNSNERFLNKTMSSMSKGVCVKEVP